MNELMINLRAEQKVPLYEQIYDYIKDDIKKGRIQSGEKLPSTRALSAHLEVSRSTVELAYEQLLSEGYIEAQPYRGYFVCQIDGLFQIDAQENNKRENNEQREQKYRYDFTPSGVDLKSFPYNIWRKLSRECLVDDKAELFRLGCPQGEYGLRNAICSYLHQARGVNCTPEQIIVGAGNDYLLMLLGMILGGEHKIALENPTYKQAYRLFKNLSYEVCTVDMDDKGMRVDELRKSDADIAFVMPSHQYPLGIVMPIKRRMELLKWAQEKEERFIIEDDYDSEFRYRGKPVPSLQASDAAGKVIYMGTFSKSIAPAIRVGYMVLPEALLERYRQKCACFSCTVSRVDQAVLEQFLDSGAFERHLNRMRKSYSRKHEALLDGLKPFFRQFDLSGENAGLHLLLTDRVGRSEKELVDAARRQGVKVYGLSSALVGAAVPEAVCRATVLIGFGGLTEDEIRDGLERLAAAWLIEKRL